MSAIVYWFSGTGNSLHAARRSAEKLEDVEFVSIAEAMRTDEPPRVAEVTGLAFPVYAWGPPAIVERFLQRLPGEGAGYVFGVFTCGSSAGATGTITQDLLRQRGLDLHASWVVKMVENYPPFGGAPEVDRQRARLAAADEHLSRIAQAVAARDTNNPARPNWFLGWLGGLIRPLFLKSLGKADRKFRADDKCTSCGLCAKICPVGDIELRDGRPHWRGYCEQCYACFHFCPVQAIQRKKTENQVRYHHPEVRSEDLLAQGREE